MTANNVNDWIIHPSLLLNALFTQSKVLFPRICAGLIVFILWWIISLIAKKMIIQLAHRKTDQRSLFLLLARTTKITSLIIGFVTALGTMGINVTALVTSLGLVGFAVGFALKDTLSNICAGFIILFHKPFSIADPIKILTLSGVVTEVNLRYTILKNQSDGTINMIPNSTVLTNIVTLNNERPPTS